MELLIIFFFGVTLGAIPSAYVASKWNEVADQVNKIKEINDKFDTKIITQHNKIKELEAIIEEYRKVIRECKP